MTEAPLLRTEEFTTFAGVPTKIGEGFSLENADADSVVGYMARLCITESEQLRVSFQTECPAEFAGGVLIIDLYNDEAGYDNLEQQYQQTVQEGRSETEFWLSLGDNPPEEAFLRFFTLDPAGYRLENVRIYRGEPLPKVPAGPWAGVGICFLLLAGTVLMWIMNRGDKRRKSA